jgi:hypothetical protein
MRKEEKIYAELIGWDFQPMRTHYSSSSEGAGAIIAMETAIKIPYKKGRY